MDHRSQLPERHDKELLRKVFLRKRKTLTASILNARSQQIAANFMEYFSDWPNKMIHVFLPIQKQAEVNTWFLIKKLREKEHQITVSRSDLNSNKMSHYLFKSDTELLVNKWGIPEPINATKIDTKKIDVILSPLIVSDRKGARVGYGRGYYDRFYGECRADSIKIGLSLLPPVDTLNLESHDVLLDYCITHHKVYSFGEF